VRHMYRGSYAPDEHGAYRARGWQPRLAQYFSLDQEQLWAVPHAVGASR